MSNPETIEGLMGMALLMKDPKRNDGLVALNVINDNNASESVLARGRKSLERTAMVAAAVDVKVATATRLIRVLFQVSYMR